MNIIVAQSYTEKYSSINNRYEYYDSNGKLIAYKKWNSIQKRYDIEYLGSNSSSREYNNFIEPYDLDFMYKAMEYKQNRIDNNLDKVKYKLDYIKKYFELIYDNINIEEPSITLDNLIKLATQFNGESEDYVKNIRSGKYDISSNLITTQILNNLSYFETELKKIAKEIENERNLTINRMNGIISFYNSFTNFPAEIKDGWHIVYAMNNKDFCEERKVYVKDNKVTKYVIDDWKILDIQYTSPISSGKTKILVDENKIFLDLYFLDFINNPNKIVASPPPTGKVSFWTNSKKEGSISIFIEGKFVGTVDSFFDNEKPTNCEQIGSLIVNYKVGTYSYEARSKKGGKWKGSFTIKNSSCILLHLSIKN